MNINEFEDRQNDWLAQEMRREGYVNNTSGLEKDHMKHERSNEWDAGAISNAREHETRHKKYMTKNISANKTNINGDKATTVVVTIVFTLMILYFVFLFLFNIF